MKVIAEAHRKSDPGGGASHPFHVLLWPEKTRFSIWSGVSLQQMSHVAGRGRSERGCDLHPFKHGGGVLEARACRVQSKWSIWLDFRRGPSCLGVECRYHHMVGAVLNKEWS